MSPLITDSEGHEFLVSLPCIFCGYVDVTRLYNGSGTGYVTKCPANGNGDHITENQYPPEVIAVIKKSRGISNDDAEAA